MKWTLVGRSAVSKEFCGLLSVSKAYSPHINVLRSYANVLPKFQFIEKKEKHEVVSGKVRNGTRWAAGDVAGLMGACTVMYQIGSRDELSDDLGATHFVRVGSINSGLKCTGFLKTRILRQKGAIITVRTDRQSMAFTVTCAPPLFDDVKDFLIDTGVPTQFEHYNLSEVRRIVREDLNKLAPEQRTLDLLQTASFTGCLSNSIFCPAGRVDTMSAVKLRNFMKKCSPVNCTVGSWGIPRGQVMELAEKLVTPEPPDTTSVRGSAFAHRSGFEYHDTGRGSTTYVGLSVPGEGTKNFENCLKYTIIAAACGSGAIPAMIPVRRHLSTALSVMYPTFTCRAFHISYSDAGIFGFLLRAAAEDASCLALKLADYFQNILPQISVEELELAKRRLLIATSIDMEHSCEDAAFGLALATALEHGGGLEDVHESIESVAATDLQTLAKSIGDKCNKGQIAVAVVGDVEAVPIHEIQKVV